MKKCVYMLQTSVWNCFWNCLLNHFSYQLAIKKMDPTCEDKPPNIFDQPGWSNFSEKMLKRNLSTWATVKSDQPKWKPRSFRIQWISLDCCSPSNCSSMPQGVTFCHLGFMKRPPPGRWAKIDGEDSPWLFCLLLAISRIYIYICT